MGELTDKLIEYGYSDFYPFHMPGHKRVPYDGELGDVLSIDITEIDGFDNLNDPEEGEVLDNLIRSYEEEYAPYVHQSYLMVNGSTGGLMAAIRAAVSPGEGIIMGRNCHKSVYRAAECFGLNTYYFYPDYVGEYGIFSGTNVDALRQMLETTKSPDRVGALVITSPTYEGVIEDIRQISNVAHEFGLIVIVDEAHGAHLPFTDVSKSAISNGADIVVQSLHKTLPSMTQTAIVHVTKSGVECFENLAEKVDNFIHAFQSTSPSYVLMSSMDRCLDIIKDMKNNGGFEEYISRINDLRRGLSDEETGLKALHLLNGEEIGAYAYDEGKIVITTAGTDITGPELMVRLRQDYHIECEMCSMNYVVMMTSIMDSAKGLERLLKALSEIDNTVKKVREVVISKAERKAAKKKKLTLRLVTDDADSNGKLDNKSELDNIKSNEENSDVNYSVNFTTEDQAMTLSDARKRPVVKISLRKIKLQLEEGIVENSIYPLEKVFQGFVSGGYVMIYPPGIPILAPGERVKMEQIVEIEKALNLGINVVGLDDGKIKIVM